MKFWKWDIRSIHKEDEISAENFRKIVQALDEMIDDTIEMIEDYNPRDNSLITRVFYMANTLKTCILLYEDNKFSRPFTTINLIQTMEQANNKMCTFQQMLIRYKTIIERIVPRLQEKMSMVYDDDEELSESDIRIQETVDQLEKHIQLQSNLIVRDLVALKVAIQYDLFRIASGVDIIRSHYDLNKRYPKGKAKFHVEIMHERPISKEG